MSAATEYVYSDPQRNKGKKKVEKRHNGEAEESAFSTLSTFFLNFVDSIG